MKRLILCSLLVVLLASGQIQAVPIYSTLGPGDSYHLTSGWSIGYPGSEYDTGVPFAVSAGVPHTLDSIEIAAGWIEGTREIDVWLMSDAAGEPGRSSKRSTSRT